MRRCKIPASACSRADHPCCEDCDAEHCKARCENRPDCCGYSGEAPARGMPRKYDRGKIVKLHAKGMTNREIADHIGCHIETVRQALKKVGQGGCDG